MQGNVILRNKSLILQGRNYFRPARQSVIDRKGYDEVGSIWTAKARNEVPGLNHLSTCNGCEGRTQAGVKTPHEHISLATLMSLTTPKTLVSLMNTEILAHKPCALRVGHYGVR